MNFSMYLISRGLFEKFDYKFFTWIDHNKVAFNIQN